jgi:hypothetical protein
MRFKYFCTAETVMQKLYDEEVHGFCCSSSIIRVIKSRRIRWTGHVLCMGEKRNACKVLVRTPERSR